MDDNLNILADALFADSNPLSSDDLIRNIEDRSRPPDTPRELPSVNQSRPSNTPYESINIDQSLPNNTLSENQINPSTQRRGKKGKRLKKVSPTQSSWQKIPIQFDRYWKPIGPNKTKYTNFLGLLSRKKASILVEEWKNVPDSAKNSIWDTVQLTYDVPQSEALRKKTLSYCCTRWRAFKTQLACSYVHNKRKGGNPCKRYPFLDESTLQEFYRIRTSEKALQKRVKAIENGSKNDCPHTMSRGGYAKAEKDLMAAKQKKLEEQSQSDPSLILSPPSPIRREDKWKYAHQKRSGAYTSEHARVIGEKIEVLQQQQIEGSFITEGRNDILTVAIGKPDYPGRVRGVGGSIGFKDYFGPRPRHSSNMVPRDEVDALLASVRAEARAEVEASLDERLEAHLSKMREEMMSMLSMMSSRPPNQPVT